MDYREAEEYIQEAAKRGSCLGLERIGALLSCLGNPQDELKFVHIAGTNGKGSVLAYVSTVLTEAGYRVGCYSSPAVMDSMERIRVNGKNIRREQYARLALKVKAAEKAAEGIPEGMQSGRAADNAESSDAAAESGSSERLAEKAATDACGGQTAEGTAAGTCSGQAAEGPAAGTCSGQAADDAGNSESAEENSAGATIFEVETAIAFLYFLEERCDLVVLEAGLGGALDATNVVKNTVCAVFSSISRDHLGVLGNTIEEIAENKAGIIKPGCMVVSARQPDAVRAVIRKRAEKCAETAPRPSYRLGQQTPGDCMISSAETAPDKTEAYRETAPDKTVACQETEPVKNKSYRGAASGKNESCREAAPDKHRLYREAEPDKLAVEEENFRRLCVSYKTHRHITSRLTGAGQKENLPTALEVLDALRDRGYAIPEEAVHRGIEQTTWPGRFTCLSEDPLLFIDGAHNEDAAKKLRATIEQTLSGYRLVLILGVFRDKEYEKICEILCPLAETVFTVDLPDKTRSLPAKELAETARRYCRDVRAGAGIRETVEEAVEEVKKKADGEKEAVLACGSLSYLKEVSRAAKELL